MKRRRQLRAAMMRQVVEAAIAAEEECKSVRISEPHFIPTHVYLPGSNANSPSVSIRSPGLTVHCLSRRRNWPPLVGQLLCPRIVRVLRTATLVEPQAFCHYYPNDAFGDPRSGTGTRSGGDAGSPSAPASHPSRVPRIHDTARRIRDRLPPRLIARCHQWKESTVKPAGKAISTPRGEGTRGTTGDREQVWGQRLGRVLITLPWFPLTPNLACTNEETPRGESPEATRPDSRGHTARHRRPHGRESEDTLAQDTLAQLNTPAL